MDAQLNEKTWTQDYTDNAMIFEVGDNIHTRGAGKILGDTSMAEGAYIGVLWLARPSQIPTGGKRRNL